MLFNCYATADILTKFYSNASCFSLLLLYLDNSQVSVYRTIGPTLVIIIILFCLRSYFVSGNRFNAYLESAIAIRMYGSF